METNVIPATPSSLGQPTPTTPIPMLTPTPTTDDQTYPHPPTTIRVTIYTTPTATPIARFAQVNAAAGLLDDFTLLTNSEKLNIPVTSITTAHLLAGNVARIEQKSANGAIMVEAGNFAAVACWEPPSCTAAMEAEGGDLSFPALPARPMMRSFVYEAAIWRRKAVRGRRYWHLSLMGRDPGRRDVRGAVRSVLEAGIWWAQRDQLPIWLEAGNQRAREVYAAFGFRELGVTWHGKEGARLPIWMMIWEPSDSCRGESHIENVVKHS